RPAAHPSRRRHGRGWPARAGPSRLRGAPSSAPHHAFRAVLRWTRCPFPNRLRRATHLRAAPRSGVAEVSRLIREPNGRRGNLPAGKGRGRLVPCSGDGILTEGNEGNEEEGLTTEYAKYSEEIGRENSSWDGRGAGKRMEGKRMKPIHA